MYVVYATRTLDLAWIPAEAAVVVVHNDDALDRDGMRADVIHVAGARERRLRRGRQPRAPPPE